MTCVSLLCGYAAARRCASKVCSQVRTPACEDGRGQGWVGVGVGEEFGTLLYAWQRTRVLFPSLFFHQNTTRNRSYYSRNCNAIKRLTHSGEKLTVVVGYISSDTVGCAFCYKLRITASASLLLWLAILHAPACACACHRCLW